MPDKAKAAVIALERGALTLTLDFELIWGYLDSPKRAAMSRACELERTRVIGRLLDLLTEFEVSATWCVVGHLFLNECQAVNGVKHPEIVPPQHSWCPGTWFEHDPCGTEQNEKNFYARSLIEKIRACPVPQEIGCHSFSHVIFGDVGCSRKTAESEVAACVKLANEMGIEMRSFVFPRNRVGHLDVLRDHGFACFRGPEPTWDDDRWPAFIKRARNLWNVLVSAEPPVVLPRKTSVGLWDIPASMIYFPIHGMRRLIPISARVKRAKKGVDAAVREKKVFHLWFHPTNMAFETDKMFAGLRAVLHHASALRAQRKLDIRTMASLVDLY